MAIAVASTSIYNNGGINVSAIIPKPSGLAVGDLMIAFCVANDTNRGTSLSGWTQILSDNVNYSCFIFYKVATSGDVAASNFTFDFSNSGSPFNVEGVILRITGYNTTNIIGASASARQTGANPSFANTITPLSHDSLIIMALGMGGASGASAYAIATSSPSFTEVVSNSVAAIAYGIRPQVTATGNSSVTASNQATTCFLIAIRPYYQDTLADVMSLADGKITKITSSKSDSMSMTESLDDQKSRGWVNTNKGSASWNNTTKT